MSVLRWQLLPSLGRALLRLAGLLGASGYADHYARDLGLPAEPAAAPAAAGQAGGGPGQAAASASPPDMFRALQALLGGQRDGGGAVPLLVAQKAGCVRRSADLLAAYGLLAEAAASLSASLSLEAAQVGGCGWCMGRDGSWARCCDAHCAVRYVASAAACHFATMLSPDRVNVPMLQASDLLQAAAHRIVHLLVRPLCSFNGCVVERCANRILSCSIHIQQYTIHHVTH